MTMKLSDKATFEHLLDTKCYLAAIYVIGNWCYLFFFFFISHLLISQ